jgi:hypothetical protein
VISHVVLFRPKPDLSPADRDGLIAAFRTAVLEIPTVRGVRAGRRVTHGAAYEQTAANLDILIAIEFDDLAGLQTYLRHPAHAAVSESFNRLLDSGWVFDYEAGDLTRLRDFVQASGERR